MRLEGKVVLITGSTGIAEATALLAAKEGAKLFIVGKDRDTVEALSAPHLVADLTDPDAATRAATACHRKYGRIDCLFNVAGASGRSYGDGPVDQCTDEGWSKTLDVNLTTTFRMCREVLRVMLEQGSGGAILNTTSVLAYSPEREYFATHAYAASKAALIGLTQSMAAYYAPENIRVNAIAPGLVKTPMSHRAQGDQRVLDFIATKQPLSGGMLDVRDIASAAVFLLSDDASATTGLIYSADGGWSVS